jgi:dTDP-4-amino-4,6-dideoxygalactose transaminase
VLPKSGLPHTERSAARVLSLPLFPELTREQVELTADAIKAWDKAQGCCSCCGCK